MISSISHDCRLFLLLRADDQPKTLQGRANALFMRQLAQDISPGGYIQDAHTTLHNQEQRVLRDLSDAKGEQAKYLNLLLSAIEEARSALQKIDVDITKKRVR